MKTKNLRKELSMKVGEYRLRVENFNDWLEAIEEIEIGRRRILLSSVLELREIDRMLEGLSFPSWLDRAADKIVCLLILKHPEGLTKEELSSIIDIKMTLLTTVLTSGDEELVRHLVRDDDIYKLHPESLAWGIEMLRRQKESWG